MQSYPTPAMPEASQNGGTAAAPRRILFFLYHAGYLRHYVDALRLLARDGHVIHLAFTVIEKDSGDRRLAEALARRHPTITFGTAPRRSRSDRWRAIALLVRAFTDLARYTDPGYADATALRERMATKIRRAISGVSDPVSRRMIMRLVDVVAFRLGPRGGRRTLRLLASAEQAIPASRRITNEIAAFAPDVVLVTPLVDFASSQVDFVKSAGSLGIPTVACIASWDNLTNKGLLRCTPDRVLVWNDAQRRELSEYHGIDEERSVAVGAAKFDPWFERRPTRSREELAAAAGIRPEVPFLLYVCSSYFIAPDEVEFVRRWLRALRASEHPELRSLGVVVRPHPQNAAQWRGVDLQELGNVAVWPAVGAQPDDEGARADFFDSIHHSAAVVGVNTSAMIDAAIVGRNVLTVLDPAFAATQRGTLHFAYLLRENGGFLNIASSFDEHHGQLLEVLRGQAEAERVRGFIESFVRPHGLDAPVAPILARAILDGAASEPAPAHIARSASAVAMRAVLSVAATAALAVGAVGRLRRGASNALRGRPASGGAVTGQAVDDGR